jgi:hypothetical protein
MAKPKQEQKSTKGGSTTVEFCSCQHEYQDEVYGKNKRLKIYNTTGQARCTVCGK